MLKSFDLELEADVSPWHHAHMGLSIFLFCFYFREQDVGTVCKRAAATFPLLDSPMGTLRTCTASGESL